MKCNPNGCGSCSDTSECDGSAETITITKAEYDKLLEAEKELMYLNMAGVDNWSGYAYAWELMREESGLPD